MSVCGARQFSLESRKDFVARPVDFSTEDVFDSNRMNDDFFFGSLFRSSFRRVAGNEGWTLHQCHQLIVGTAGCPFGKDDQRAFCVLQDFNGLVNRLAIHAFAVHAEGTQLSNRHPGQPALVEQMPAGHCIKIARRFTRHEHHDHRVGQARMVRRQQDTVSCIEGSL